MNLAKFITYTLWFAGTSASISYIATHKAPMDVFFGIPIFLSAVIGGMAWIVMFVSLLLHEFED